MLKRSMVHSTQSQVFIILTLIYHWCKLIALFGCLQIAPSEFLENGLDSTEIYSICFLRCRFKRPI